MNTHAHHPHRRHARRLLTPVAAGVMIFGALALARPALADLDVAVRRRPVPSYTPPVLAPGHRHAPPVVAPGHRHAPPVVTPPVVTRPVVTRPLPRSVHDHADLCATPAYRAGYDAGAKYGWSDGYRDGLSGLACQPQPRQGLHPYRVDYRQGFKAGYRQAYENGFAAGQREQLVRQRSTWRFSFRWPWN